MRRYAFYFAVALFAFGFGFFEGIPNVNAQKSKEQNFYIESQPDSPLLIRDLTAVILPVNKYRSAPQIEITFYIENRSKKNIAEYSVENPAVDASTFDSDDAGIYPKNLMPGESYQGRLTISAEVESLVYRIGYVAFEDGTEWNAKPFNGAKAKKSAPVKAVPQSPSDNTTKRILMREWTAPIFIDRVTKTLEGKPTIIDRITVQTKLHEINAEALDEVEGCPVSADKMEFPSGEIIYSDHDFRVEKFTTYQVKGRVFAYSVPYEGIEAETKYEIGVGFESIYVDENGSGVFILRCEARDLDSLPEWVKTFANSK
jgi:hypothetical protein